MVSQILSDLTDALSFVHGVHRGFISFSQKLVEHACILFEFVLGDVQFAFGESRFFLEFCEGLSFGLKHVFGEEDFSFVGDYVGNEFTLDRTVTVGQKV